MRRLIQPALALGMVAMSAGPPVVSVVCSFLCTSASPHVAKTAAPSSAHHGGTHHAVHQTSAEMPDGQPAEAVEPFAERTCNDPRPGQRDAVIASPREDELMATAGPELAWLGNEGVAGGRAIGADRRSPDLARRAFHPLVVRRI